MVYVEGWMVQLHTTSTPIHASVMMYVEGSDGRAVTSNGIAEASNMCFGDPAREGEWYLNRLKCNVTGEGYGGRILSKLQELLQDRSDFQRLIVEPGGYGSDVNRLIRFYESHGFRKNTERECWIWEPTKLAN